jgi:WS/DGAT/MGAT family acyltransferase
VPHPDRLSALDSVFLDLEGGGAHMHVAAVLVFEGEPPTAAQLMAAVEDRLDRVPRYRQRLAHVPLGQGRPVWVDDPHFCIGYHIRHAALPRPGSDAELKRLAGRVFANALDRTKPLWEMYLVEGLSPTAQGRPRFALISKTHHALVDGVSGADLSAVMFDLTPDPPPPSGPKTAWVPRPAPTSAQLLADSLNELATTPTRALRSLRDVVSSPRDALGSLRQGAGSIGTFVRGGAVPAPSSPLNVETGPHRRYTWVDADLPVFKRIKDVLGGTVNDVVVASVALGLGRWLRSQGHDTEGLVLRALIPVSVRAEAEFGALGNRVAAMFAPLPVGVQDPKACFEAVHESMSGLKRSGQAVGAKTLTGLAQFAPPTIMSQAARLQARQRFFNLVVTNVPGPQFPLYLLGRRLVGLYPVVPLARRQALGIAIFSYDGRLGFGLLADYDALPGVEDVARHIGEAIEALAQAADPVTRGRRPRTRSPRSRREAPAPR